MIYVHVPYCRSFCTYCDFYSELSCGNRNAFVDAACVEIAARSDEIRAGIGGGWKEIRGDRDAVGNNTLYIGGGTPSVLSLDELKRIVSACRAAAFPGENGSGRCRKPDTECRVSGGGTGIVSGQDPVAAPGHNVGFDGNSRFDEFTVEVNPDDIVQKGPSYAEGLLRLGVDRISMGIQSLDDRVLGWMNRRHDYAAARKAYRILREAGFRNISIDLIFGYDMRYIPGFLETGDNHGEGNVSSGTGKYRKGWEDAAVEHWSRTVEQALDISGDGSLPQHVSAYQLSVEDGSALAQSVEEGKYTELPEDVCAEQYSVLCRSLKDAGYHHYEISNFALPGYEARHNSAYWSHVPYAGIGPGAHSLVYRPSFLTDVRPAQDLSDNQTSVPVQIPGASYGHAEVRSCSSSDGQAGGRSCGLSYSQAEGRSYGSSDSLHTGMGCPPPGGEASGTDRETCGLMRRWNIPDVAAYLQAAVSGDWDGIRESEYLSREQYVTEEIMLGLRTDRGVPRRLLMSESSRERNTEKLLRTGSLVPVGGVVLKQAGSEKESRLRIPEDHFFVSDDIISDLL